MSSAEIQAAKSSEVDEALGPLKKLLGEKDLAIAAHLSGQNWLKGELEAAKADRDQWKKFYEEYTEGAPRVLAPNELNSNHIVAYVDGQGDWHIAGGKDGFVIGSERVVLLEELKKTELPTEAGSVILVEGAAGRDVISPAFAVRRDSQEPFWDLPFGHLDDDAFWIHEGRITKWKPAKVVVE